MHTAHRRRQFKRSQDIAHRITVKAIVAVGALQLLVVITLRQYFPANWLPPLENPGSAPDQPLFPAGRTTIGIERMLEHNHIMLTQRFDSCSYGISIKKSGSARRDLHRHVTELSSRLKQDAVCHRVLRFDGHTAATLLLSETSLPPGLFLFCVSSLF